MSFRWKTQPDDDNDDDRIIIFGYSDDLKETMQNVILQLDYVIELFETISSANPESPEYQEAKTYIAPAVRGLGLTFNELITAVDATEGIDDRQKERLLSLIDETSEYFQQMQNGELSLHGLVEKLKELKNTVEQLMEPTEAQIHLANEVNQIIQMLEKFKQVKNGDALLLMMDNFERRWKPVVKLIADDWSALEVFTELPTLQFLNPRNKQKLEHLIDTIIAKIRILVSK